MKALFIHSVWVKTKAIFVFQVYFNLVYLHFLGRGSVYLPCLPMHKFWYYLLSWPYTEQSAGTKTREGPKKVPPQARPIFSLPQPRIWPHLLISIHGVGILTHIILHLRPLLNIWIWNNVTSGFEMLLAQINTAMVVNLLHQVFAKSLQLMNWVWLYSFIWQKFLSGL